MRRTGAASRCLVVLLGLAATASGLTAAMGTATAVPGGHIIGVVTGTGGVPLDDVHVSAFRDDDGGWTGVSGVSTTEDGSYDLSGLSTGTYRLQFQDTSAAGYLGEFYEGAASVGTATDIAVTAGQTTTGKDAQLAPGGRITGTVTGDGGAPLSGVTVTAYRDDGSGWQVVTGRATVNGSYDLYGLTSGTYRLRFSASSVTGYLTEYYDDAASLGAATGIPVTAGETTAGRDAQLTLGGRISGQLMGTGGSPPTGGFVTAYRPSGSGWEVANSVYAASDGSYDLPGLATGVYRLYFQDFALDGHLAEYYDNAASVGAATEVAVTAGQTTTVSDATLALGGHIKGTLTRAEDSDTPLTGIYVNAYRDSGNGWQSNHGVYVGLDGSYDVSGLPAGTYRLRFSDYSGNGYLTEFYDDVATVEAAADIVLAAGQTATGKDAQLALGGHITGTVTGAGDAPVIDIAVTAFRDDGDGWAYVSDTSTTVDGTYDLSTLATGSYRLRFRDYSDAAHLTEFYDDAATLEAATDITVTAGQTTTGKDAQLTVGGRITGTVTAAGTGADTALSDVSVTAYRNDGNGAGWAYVTDATTAGDGTYTLFGLTSGTYRLRFQDFSGAGYQGEYFDDVATLGAATDVPVTAGLISADKDAQLSEGGHITGTVTDAVAGTALSGIAVTAYRDDGAGWENVTSIPTTGDGSYDISGLPTGTYRLRFADDSGAGYLPEYYDDAASLEAATDIAVTAGEITTGNDADLVVGGQITGTITGTDDTPLPDIVVTAYRDDGSGWDNVSSTSTADDGSYDLPLLPTDTYRLRFEDPSDAHVTEYYDNAETLAAATDVLVSAGAVTQDKDAQLGLPVIVLDTFPTLTANPRVGVPVIATPGTWNLTEPNVAYQWMIGGEDIAGATGASYTPKPGDVGKTLAIRVTASFPGYDDAYALAFGATVGKGTLQAGAKPAVTGRAKKGATLKASPGTWSPAKVTVTYRWYAGSTPIGKATRSKLVLTGRTLSAVTRKTITVRVTVSASGYTSVTTKLKVPGKVR